LLSGEACDLNAVWASKQDVFTCTAGHCSPCCRHLAVVALQGAEAFVAAVARINIDDDQPIGDDAEIGLRCLPTEPCFDQGRIGCGRAQTIRRELAVGVFCGTRRAFPWFESYQAASASM
jgi:hypothetical protein